MENGENAYRRYLDGDDGGMTEIIRLYKDGLIIYINGFCTGHPDRRGACRGNLFQAGGKKTEIFRKILF